MRRILMVIHVAKAPAKRTAISGFGPGGICAGPKKPHRTNAMAIPVTIKIACPVVTTGTILRSKTGHFTILDATRVEHRFVKWL
jgi:hypothetical protein